MVPRALVRQISLALTLITGFTALVYEVTWHYYLSNLLGSQARSAALIVATFLGGLAVGYSLFGRFSMRRAARTLITACGVLEVLIGVWTLLFPQLERGVWWLQFESQLFKGSIATDIILAVLLLGAPTVMMGASLPLLTQGLSRDVHDAAPFHAKIYVVNTFGAFLGALTAGFFLIPALGLDQTMMVMGVANVSAGALFVLIGRSLPSTHHGVGESIGETPQNFEVLGSKRLAILLGVACIGGFVSITLQTVLVRVTALAIGASVYTFGMVLSAFIFALALGAWLLSERRILRLSLASNQVLVIGGLIGLYFVVPFLPYWSHVLRTLLTSGLPNFWIYHLLVFVALCALIVVPVGAIGAMLPLLFKESRDRAELLGRRVGLVYGANTVGCVIGAIIGGYVSLYFLNLDQVLLVCVVGAACILLLLSWDLTGRRGSALRIVALVALALPCALQPWPHFAMGRGTFRMTKPTDTSYAGFDAFYDSAMSGQNILAYKDDPNTTVTVLETAGGGRSIIINGKSDGSTRSGDRVTTKLMAHLPGLLQTSESTRAAVVGFGTGITVGSLSLLPEVETIDILEISPAVKDFSHQFDEENGKASQSSKIRWNIGDAYRFLLETPYRYAIIASEPSNPWVGGVERLYSKDFFDLARSKLAPGGIYAQWFHTYSISQDTMALVLRTFHSAFPYVHLFERDSDVVLLGSNEPIAREAVEGMKKKFERPEIREDLKDIGVESPNAILARELPMPWEGLSAGPIQTLNRPTLSYRAGKDFFTEAYVSAVSFAGLPEYRGYARQFFPHTLMATLYGTQTERELLQSMALLHCAVHQLQDGGSWEQQTQLCRQALVAMVVLGEIPVNKTVTENVQELFTKVSPAYTGELLVAPNVEEAAVGLDWMSEYGAPFLKVDAGKMKHFAQPCFQGTTEAEGGCRSRLILALASNEFFAEAKEEFLLMRHDRVPLRNLEYARALARVAGVPLSENEEAQIPQVE